MSFKDCECGNPRHDYTEGCNECREMDKIRLKLNGYGPRSPKRYASQPAGLFYYPTPYELPRVVPPTLGVQKMLRYRLSII